MDETKKAELKRLVEESNLGFEAIAKELGMGFQTLKLRMAENGLKIKRILVDSTEATR